MQVRVSLPLYAQRHGGKPKEVNPRIAANRKGEMSRVRIETTKKLRLELQVTIVKYILSLFGPIVLLLGQPVCLGLLSLC
jgi:hypothetical protein